MSEHPAATSFFIEKNGDEPPKGKPARRLRWAWPVVILFTLIYLALLAVIAHSLRSSGFTLMGAGAVFVFGIVGGIGVQQLIALYSRSQSELGMLLEVLEGSRGARLITDERDRSVYTNLRFNRMVESLGTPSLETLTGLFAQNEEGARAFHRLAEEARSGRSESVELPTKLGGKDAWLQITAQPISGWPGYIHWRVDDITVRHEMERAVRAEREKLFDFTDNAPVGFFSVDENGKFIFANRTLAVWLNTTVRDLVKVRDKSLHDFLVTAPDTQLYDLFAGAGENQIGELMMKSADGRVFQASVRHSVVKGDDGRVRTRSVVHDLTPEHEMQQALQESQDRFQRLFEEAPLGICVVDTEGKILECNPIFRDLAQPDAAGPVGRMFPDLVVRDDRKGVTDWLASIREGQGAGSSREVRLKGDAGRVVQLYARRFKGGKNLVLHFIDLTAQKALELQFAQSQKMQAIGQLAGGVAHDFNNLLTAMIGFCDLLLLRHKPGDPSFADIMQIKQNSNRAANLVRQLLAFSRKQTLQPKTLDLAEVLTELSHLMRRLIGANIDLKISHGPDLGLIRVDLGQLEQVLVNLAVNARDAMPDGGALEISTKNFVNAKPVRLGDEEMPPGEWVLTTVSDTGTGIPREIISRIFEPFFTTKEPGSGTGLGLSTVYGIVRQTGGFIAVESRMGQGTTFSIYLPRHVEGADTEAEAETESAAARRGADESQDLTGSARILLVEDEDAVRAFSARALGNKGYEVLQAASGEEALALVNGDGGKIDLVVTDVVMPQMDGPTLAREIRQKFPDIKIIFISGYTEDRFKSQMDDKIWFLPKPFTLRTLAVKVKEVLEK